MQAKLKGRLKWRSRRGLLELDLILVPFVEYGFDQLAPPLQKAYQNLLQEEDQDILAWMQGQLETPPDYQGLIPYIVQWNSARHEA